MKLGFTGNLQKKMQTLLVEQAYICYKFGWHQAQVKQEAKYSKNEFCKRIKEIIEAGKRISDGVDTDELFPNEMDGIKNGEKH